MKFRLLTGLFIILFFPFLVSAQNLVPGSGWTGATNIPSPNGSPGQYGYDANVIAHWDHVPYQDAEGTINIGLLAYHLSGIQKVSFSVNNGPWIDVTSSSFNPETGIDEYWVVINESLFPSNFAGNVEVRAIAYPNVGTPKVLQGTSVIRHDSSMIVSVDRANTLSDNVAYVTVTGNDGNNCLTLATACRTIIRAMNAVAIAGNLDGAEVRLGEGTWTLPSSSGFSTPTRFFTLTSIAGTNRDNIIINSYASGSPTSKYRLSRLSLIRGAGFYYPIGEIWIDNSKIYKPTPWLVSDGAYEAGDMLGYASPTGGNEYHAYYTDIYINNTGHGPSNLILGRNIIAENTNDGHASGTQTLINYWIYNVLQLPPAHADYYQFYANYDDIIIKGGGNVQVPGSSIASRGLATSSGGLIDVAIDGINLNWNGWVFSICGSQVNNVIIKNSYFANSGNWCSESPTPLASFNVMNMANILIQDSSFNFGNSYNLPLSPVTGQPVPSPTVTYINSGSGTTIPFNFSIITNPTSGSVQIGSSVTSQVTIGLLSGSASSVDLSATNLSSGLSVIFSPTSCTPNSGTCTATMTLTASSGAQLIQNRKINVRGTSGSIVKTAIYNLNVVSTPICTSGQTQNCSVQIGVCLNSQQICMNNNWPGCNYAAITGYQSNETLCDSLDNDCDGFVDEDCSSSVSSTQSSSSSSNSGGGSSSNSVSSTSSGIEQSNSSQELNQSSLSGEDFGDNQDSVSGNIESNLGDKFSKLFWIVLSFMIFAIFFIFFIFLRYFRKLRKSSLF